MAERGRVWISPGFAVLTALFFFWDREGAAVSVFGAWTVHEAGHLAALYGAGGRVRRMELTLGGMRIVTEKGKRLSYAGELLSVLAGPGINLALAVLCAGGEEAWQLFAGANLILGMFNLLPLPGLDGGRTICLLFRLLGK